MKPEKTLNMSDDLPIGYDKDRYYKQPHDHSYYEFLYIIRGKAINVVNDTEQPLESRNLVVMRPEDVHCIRECKGDKSTFEFFNIPVSVSFMQQQFDQCDELKKTVLNTEMPRLARLSNTEFAVICSKAMQLMEMKDSQLRRYLYFNLVRELCGCIVSKSITSEIQAPEWFVDLYEAIQASDPAELNYDMVLKMANVSRTTLWSSFKNFVGKTPTMYINKRKMDEAYKLVIEGRISHTEISMYLGYNNYTHFYREFVKRYGTSLNGFKKKQ